MRYKKYREDKHHRVNIPTNGHWHEFFRIGHPRRGAYMFLIQGAFLLSGLKEDELVQVEFQFNRLPMKDQTGGVDLLYGNGRWNFEHKHVTTIHRGMRAMAVEFKVDHPTAKMVVPQRIMKVIA